MMNETGTSNATVIVSYDGFRTIEPPPICDCCDERMVPLVWLCGRCGGTAG